MSDNAPLTDLENLENVRDYLGPTPPLGKLPLRGERFWVDRPAQLLNAVNLLKQSGVVAVDAEFTQVRARTQNDSVSNIPRLALLQIAIENHCFIVDALRLQDLSPLMEVFGNPDIAVLLHGAGADMRVMAERGLQVAHYYDLEATCRSIFGQHESSLAAMLQRAFGYHLDKSLQRTDWTRRPLPPAMIAYAARDAEVTLELYYWLDTHYHIILQLHEANGQTDAVARWIEPFLRGNSTLSPEMAVIEARNQGQIHNRAQVAADCRAALVSVQHPMRRNRLLRLIADLALTQLSSDLLLLLQAPTSDERAAAVRALGRLGIKSALEPITALLSDPVLDVRKAAQTAVHNLTTKELRQPRPAPTRAADGTRSWVVENAQSQSSSDDDDNGWKSRLRSIIDA
ncbi:HEAT repeat domain-containing protein [Dictyobacter arantiisoli]|uniref:3'-5' exonuclease domain-containing protein n=1 Tax=Dictyobacter arantiisoli TaxID=2014874 RepID=A0A5A5TCX9_9CHLR|nr:HEAT repeat domain-containing protein [Dictyobacter arantiisoli]GCF09055.1 hypothetical protein KDI_26190 [Dictyobacter arantiisoli]